jgi:hypothetical protein
MDVTSEWHWEGNIVDAVIEYLIDGGWTIVSSADTYSKERGEDIRALKDGHNLIIEAKGYPSKQYRDPRRAGEKKRTNPTTQAPKWYSHAIFTAMRLQHQNMSATVAVALPDIPRYRALHAETAASLTKLNLTMLFVDEEGDVDRLGPL